MGCTSVYCVLAVAHPALVTGGTLSLILVPLLCFTPIGNFFTFLFFLFYLVVKICYFGKFEK